MGSPPEGLHCVIPATYVSTESKIDLKDALIQHGTMTTDDFNFKNKEVALKITDGVLGDEIKRTLNPNITTTGMITDLIKVSLCYITKETVDVSKLCAVCKVHSEGVCFDKSNSA